MMVFLEMLISYSIRQIRTVKEPEGSLSCSQKSAIGPDPEQFKQSPHSHTISPMIHFNTKEFKKVRAICV